MNLWLIIAVMHTTWAVVELKPEKNSGLNGIWTQDLFDTGAVLYWLSCQDFWERVTLWVRNIPIGGEECKWIYERSYIWTAERYKFMVDRRSYTHNLSSCEIKAWKPIKYIFIVSVDH